MRRPLGIPLAAILTLWAGQAGSAEIAKRLEVPTTPKTLWRAAGGFCGLSKWHPDVASCVEKKRGPEVMRLVTLKDGGVVIDRLVLNDARHQQIRYELVTGPFPVAAYKARLFIEDDDDDRDAAEDDDGTAIVWAAEFEPREGVSEDEARKALLRFFQTGLIALKEQFRSKAD
jgi:mxaD protein